MSLDYSTGAVNRIVQSANVTMGPLVSCGGWFYSLSMGESDNASMMTHGQNRSSIRFNVVGSNRLEFRCARVTGGVWAPTVLSMPPGAWRWLGVTYDGGSTANHPTMYLLDAARVWVVLTNGAGLTRTSTPSGALVSDTLPWRVGNNSGMSEQWHGYLAHLFVYNRILTESEMRLVAERGPRRFPRGGPVFSWPGVRILASAGGLVKDEAGVFDGTASGTGIAVAAEHPPARW